MFNTSVIFSSETVSTLLDLLSKVIQRSLITFGLLFLVMVYVSYVREKTPEARKRFAIIFAFLFCFVVGLITLVEIF